MENYKNQKVLFFSPSFFGYEKAIENKLSKKFAECVFYDERANPSTLEKIFIRLNYKRILNNKINNYFNTIINRYEQDYFDYVLFFNPETINYDLLAQLKSKQSKAKFILYMWDSFTNKPYTKDLIGLFDKSYTFNKEDSVLYNMSFRPLFFIDDYNDDLKKNRLKCEIDITFIGTIHSDRYKILKQVEQWANANNLKVFFYMYFPSWIVYLNYKFQNLGKISMKKKDFHFKSMTSNQISEYLSKSRVIIDIQHPNQTGLTMRTIEMLGLRKKIITTNEDIKTYDFYNTKNIRIINRDSVDIDYSFIDQDYDYSNDFVRNRYSIDSFLNEILDDKKE